MCSDNRHYTPATVNALQQAAAHIEAERRRQYRAEMAQELRGKLLATIGWNNRPTTDEERGIRLGLQIALRKIDELSPPTTCDSN